MTKKWLEARRSYLEKLKKQVALHLGPEEEAIRTYELSTVNLYNKVWQESSAQSFLEACQEHDFILCGDFHSSTSIKRFYQRFIEEHKVFFKELGPVWALECFLKEDDTWLQKWLQKKISDSELLDRVSWKERWGFHWASYKELILFLHESGFRVHSINSSQEDFADRDQEMAQNLLELKKKGRPVFCLIGQLHISSENLPSKIKLASPETSVISCHLDPEKIYFDLAEMNLLERISVLSLDSHFCFLTTPPWVHWQSYLLHLEEILDEESYDLDDEDFAEVRGEDYESAFASYLDLLKHDLEIPPAQIKRVGISFIDDYVVHGESPPDLLEIMNPMMSAEVSFYWPEEQEGILVRNSLNQVASVAGKYLHMKLMGVEKLPWGEPSSFAVWCWLEAVGYMLSKLINHKRNTKGAETLAAFLSARLGSQSGKAVLKALISTQIEDLDESIEKQQFKALSWEEVIYASRLKGALVGEGLFSLYSKGLLGVETLKAYLSLRVDKKEQFHRFFMMLLRKIEEEA